ncbi:MAG TPA: SAM-dependent methyltransferase [Stellaceae bacterium]|nr:SAM-dependent methyltransferase [Stellaceae bacterium]
MATLSDLIAQRIRALGPMSIAEFMHEALQHPRFGYYATRDPVGPEGDFITAPEASQAFGELIGLWCADIWERIGRPDPLLLVELGPGRGTLLRDALGATARIKDFRRALRIHLVETGARLRQVQQERLGEYDPTWHRDLGDVPAGPLILIANEFLDALPIVQLERGETHWHERAVDLASDDEHLIFARAAAPSALAALVPSGLAEAAPGSIFEACPAALTIAAHLGRRLNTAPGVAVFIDYGHTESACGDTLQAVRRHRYCGILDQPGNADLTAHVDFARFAEAARAAGAATYGPVTQRDFLMRLGIEARAQQLLRAASAQRDAVAAGIGRLLDPQEMGTLFKVLAIASPGLPAPDGFAEHRS